MENTAVKSYEAVLEEIRSKLAMKRGYGSRVKKKLQKRLPEINLNQIYAVAWGKKKDPIILKALMEEVKQHKKNPIDELVTGYLKAVA